MTVIKTRLLVVGIICLVMFVMLAPIETSVIPQWRVQVVDESGTPCANMRVTQSWGHYRLYLDGKSSSEDRYTDPNGYVEFPERTIRASLIRRIIVPVVTRITTLMHGGWDVSGAVWASGIKDVAWLSYKSGRSLPGKMRVERCTQEALVIKEPDR